MKLRNFTLVILIAILIGSLFAGMVYATENTKSIKVGFVSSFTGGMAMYGEFLEHGFMMGIDEINAAGGIQGHKIEVIKEDDCSVAASGVNAITKLVHKDNVDVIFGPNSSAITLPGSKVTREAECPEVTTSLAASITQQGNEWIFRVRTPSNLEGPAMAKFVVNTLEKKRIAVFRSSTEAGINRSDGFVLGLKEIGVEPVIVETHNVGDKDFTGQLMKIRAKNPDYLYLPVQEVEGGLIMKQARQMGWDVEFGGDSGIATDVTMNLAGDAEDGTLVIVPFIAGSTDPYLVEWVKKFKERYPEETVVDQHDACSYDGAMIIKVAIENALNDAGIINRTTIRDGLRKIKNLKCLVGTCSYDENGEGFRSDFIGIIKDGKIQYCGEINMEGEFVSGGLPN